MTPSCRSAWRAAACCAMFAAVLVASVSHRPVRAQSAAEPIKAAERVEFADPHIHTGPVEAEVTRVRRLAGQIGRAHV